MLQNFPRFARRFIEDFIIQMSGAFKKFFALRAAFFKGMHKKNEVRIEKNSALRAHSTLSSSVLGQCFG